MTQRLRRSSAHSCRYPQQPENSEEMNNQWGHSPPFFKNTSATEHVYGNTAMKPISSIIQSGLYTSFCQNRDTSTTSGLHDIYDICPFRQTQGESLNG